MKNLLLLLKTRFPHYFPFDIVVLSISVFYNDYFDNRINNNVSNAIFADKTKFQAPVFTEQPSPSSIVAEGRTKFMQCKAKGSLVKIIIFVILICVYT